MSRQRGRSERVAVIGAGPAGLSTAYYLKQQGYRDVTVFEKLGRVGGLCRSVTEGYRSFDLGGNYVTPAYRETLELARHVGAKPIKAHEYLGARDVDGEIEYLSMFDWLRPGSGRARPEARTSAARVARAPLWLAAIQAAQGHRSPHHDGGRRPARAVRDLRGLAGRQRGWQS